MHVSILRKDVIQRGFQIEDVPDLNQGLKAVMISVSALLTG